MARKGMKRKKSRSQWGVSVWGSTEEFEARIERERRLRAGQPVNSLERRIIAKRAARIDWRIEKLYEEARRLTFLTGIDHEVDHIRLICQGGEHVRENMRVITMAENRSGPRVRSEEEILRLQAIEAELIKERGW